MPICCPADDTLHIGVPPVGPILYEKQEIACEGGGTQVALVPVFVPQASSSSIASPSNTSVSDAGSTASGVAQISIANVGGSDGIVDGETLPAGGVLTYTAYHDYSSNTFFRIGSISYDANGTTFLISVTP